MESTKDTCIHLTELALLLKYKKEVFDDAKQQIDAIKAEIREIMVVNNKLKTFDDIDAKVHITMKYPQSFDVGMFKLEHPKFAQAFITQETTFKTKDIIDLNRLKKNYNKMYEEYMVDLTPSVSVK